jgi:hypothetical protein
MQHMKDRRGLLLSLNAIRLQRLVILPFFLCGALWMTIGQAQAKIVNAASPSYTDVNIAVTLAVDGDTVVVPAGTADWTNTLTYSKAITLQGAGIGNTIILEDEGVYSPELLNLNTQIGKNYRVTGFTFTTGSRANGAYGAGLILLNGYNSWFRVDHCLFTNVQNVGVNVAGPFGVVDHCTFYFNVGAGVVKVYSQYYASTNYSLQNFGDGSWSAPGSLGTINAFYLEDCVMVWTYPSGVPSATDGYGGCRVVYRNNILTNCAIQWHGTGSSGRWRGGRQFEVYNNLFVNTFGGGAAGQSRSGTGVVYSNTLVGLWSQVFTMEDYRSPEALSMWGGADGTNAFDLKDSGFTPINFTKADANNTGYQYFGLLYPSGSAQKAGATWTPNQFVGYTIRDFNQYQGPAAGDTNTARFTTIISNSTDTVYWYNGGSHLGLLLATNGDSMQITHVLQSIDCSGNGSGDQLSYTASPTPTWLHQPIDPICAWSNTINGVLSPIVASSGTIREGSNYTNNFIKPNYTPLVHPHPLVTQGTVTNSVQMLPPTNLHPATGS